MADFSKEYQELKGLKGYDFSILSEFRKLSEGYSRAMICEGFGTKAMVKEKGECIILLNNNEEINFKDLLNKY